MIDRLYSFWASRPLDLALSTRVLTRALGVGDGRTVSRLADAGLTDDQLALVQAATPAMVAAYFNVPRTADWLLNRDDEFLAEVLARGAALGLPDLVRIWERSAMRSHVLMRVTDRTGAPTTWLDAPELLELDLRALARQAPLFFWPVLTTSDALTAAFLALDLPGEEHAAALAEVVAPCLAAGDLKGVLALSDVFIRLEELGLEFPPSLTCLVPAATALCGESSPAGLRFVSSTLRRQERLRDELARGLDREAFSAVSRLDSSHQLWQVVAAHPELTAEGALTLLGCLARRPASAVGAVLAGRSPQWLEEVVEELWTNRESPAFLADVHPVLGATLGAAYRPILVRLAAARPQVLKQARAVEFDFDLVGSLPVTGAPHGPMASAFLERAQAELTTPQAWEAFEALAPDYSGTFAELLATARTL